MLMLISLSFLTANVNGSVVLVGSQLLVMVTVDIGGWARDQMRECGWGEGIDEDGDSGASRLLSRLMGATVDEWLMTMVDCSCQ